MATALSSEGQATAENLIVEAANGIAYAYRRFGNADTDAPPLLFLQHFRGNLDNWDPLLVDTIAEPREVILLDHTGVGLSSGVVPRTVTEMARDAISCCDALELAEIDLLGYSLGGMVAQDLALLRPQLVRRLVLAGTGPRGGGQLMHGWAPDVARVAKADDNGPEELLWFFFEHTETSRKLGREYLTRFTERKENRDRPNAKHVTEAQYDAIVEWGNPDRSQLNRLAGIRQPDPGRERRQRHDDPDDQQPHPRGAPAQREGADLPRRRPRLPLSVAGGVRRSGHDLPRCVTRARTRVSDGRERGRLRSGSKPHQVPSALVKGA